MNSFIRSLAIVSVLLLLGMMTVMAQEVTYSAGPGIPITLAANNGGFAWGDVNGDGFLDLLFRQNNLMINQVSSFSLLSTANLPTGQDAIGMAFADFNGDGRPDVLEITQGTLLPAILLDSAGVTFQPMTSTGDLAGNALGTFNNFGAVAAADIDHSGYLSIAWAGGPVPANNNPSLPGGGIWLLKGGASGFTNTGRWSAPGNLAIDTMLTYEAWDVRFLDANNDGYQDLLMPSFRNGFSKIDTGSSASRKGCVMFLNDGTGKFSVPTAATLGRTIYALDTAGTWVERHVTGSQGQDSTYWFDSLYVVANPAKIDTGIIVDDTVRHFTAIGEQWGELNNDGIQDLILNGLNTTDNYNGKGGYDADIILYGRGDGTFTYKWDGVTVVSNNGIAQVTSQRSLSTGDYNNDGLQDIYTIQTYGPQHLYRNNGDGTFTDVATADGLATSGARSGQFVDYNNDGFVDIFQYTGTTILLQKNGGNSNHWVAFRPVGLANNKSAIGARFTVYAGSTMQIRDIKAEAGSAGMGGQLNATFGLGTATAIDSVTVRWPDGVQQSFNYIEIDKYYTIVENEVIPDVPTLATPADGAGSQPLALNLTWNTAANAASYQVQVSLDPTFATNIIANDSLVAGTSQAIANLGGTSQYYWRVRSLGTASRLWSPWSAANSFTTITMTPSAISLILPASNSIQPATVTFRVSQSVGAAQYHWQLSNDPAFGTNLVDDLTTDSTRNIGPLASGLMYYWRVNGVNGGGSGPVAGPDSFLVMLPPDPPAALLTPTSNQQSVRVDTVVFTWSASATASSYECQLSTSPTMSPLVVVNDTTLTNSFTVTNLTRNINYYWRVRAMNVGGASGYTAIDSFKTIVPVPPAPTLVTPGSGSTVERNPLLTWRTSNFATSYRVQVSTNSGYTGIVFDQIVTDTTVRVSPPLASTTLHYWHVAGIDTAGQGSYSGSRIFTTDTSITGVNDLPFGRPVEYALQQNYPNPFNPSTKIDYDIPMQSHVKIFVYDVLGRQVANLVNGVQSANRYSITWNASNLGSGIYFYRIYAKSLDGSKEFTSVKKLLLVK